MLLAILVAIGLVVVAAACGDDPTPTTRPTATPTTVPTPTVQAGPTYDAATGARNVDGADEDWAGVPVLAVPLKSLDGQRDLTVDLQVSFDSSRIYTLVTVPDDFNATPGDHHGSGSCALLWAIAPAAGPHMGTDGVDFATSLGLVDIWHWEIDCGPGVVSGGIGRYRPDRGRRRPGLQPGRRVCRHAL